MSSNPFKPLAKSDSGNSARQQENPIRQIVTPVPADAPAVPDRHPTEGVPSETWTYRDAHGSAIGQVFRFDNQGSKSYRPMTLWMKVVDGKLEWRWESWPPLRPLYGVDRLAAMPGAPVVVTEGEKAADAVTRLLPHHVAVSSPSGSRSAAKADWSPLSGREVVIWPDADEAGRSYAEDVTALVLDAGAGSVAIATPPDEVAEGWDAADAESDGWTEIDATQLIIDAALLETPDETGEAHENAGTNKKKKKKEPPQADRLLECASPCELWHSPENEAYATIPVNGHQEHWKLDSAAFCRWLDHEYYRATGRAPRSAAVSDALRILKAKAIHDGPEHVPFRRTGRDDNGDLWIDLCDVRWRAIRITAVGWTIVDRPAVKFIRSDTMAALPEPQGGEPIENLRRFINTDDESFVLVVGWTLAALWGGAGAYPILVIGGEQGSGKSILTRLLSSVVDPQSVTGLAPPNDERDLIVMAKNAHLLAFDNLSRIDAKLSDSLCRMSTGGGFITRKLHTDSEPNWFFGSRPSLLNGIPSLMGRSDLADRAITIPLHRIDESARQPESEWWADWENVRPLVLGALCDALVGALGRIESTRSERLPRMADFAKLMIAAEAALGWEEGTFMRAYSENRRQAAADQLEADAVAVAIKEFVDEKHPETGWQGTATDLLAELNTLLDEKNRSKPRSWPPNAGSLGNAIARSEPVLRTNGVDVDKRRTDQARLIILTRVC